MNSPNSEIGLIGLAVWAKNLALNIADHGFKISVFNRTCSRPWIFFRKTTCKIFSGFETIRFN